MSEQTLPLVADEELMLKWAINEWLARVKYYNLYRSYFRGHHKLLTVSTRWQRWFAEMLASTRLNLCESVVDAVTDRLAIVSWDVGTTASSNGSSPKNHQAKMQEAWEYSQGPAVMNEVHEGASVEGDAYVLVWPDGAGKLRMWPHRGDEMIVYYPPELPDVPSLALKVWRSTPETWRLNAYWPDRVDRFASKNDAMESAASWTTSAPIDLYRVLTLVQDDTGSSVPNPVKGNRVPVAHFTPGRKGNVIGDSDLKNAVPVQDALNKALIDLIVTTEGAALPLRVLTGVQDMKDPETGDSTGPKYDPRKDVWMNIANEQAKLWTAAGADTHKIVEVVEHHITNMARVTHTPPERLLARAGGVLSGASRKVAEAPLTAKALTRKQYYDPSWRETMELLGFKGVPKWGPTEYTTDTDTWTLALQKVQAGMPLPQVLIEMGYTEEMVKDMNDTAKKYPEMQMSNMANVITGAQGRLTPPNQPKKKPEDNQGTPKTTPTTAKG